MKTRIAILTLILGFFITATAFAGKPVPATKSAKEAIVNFLTEEINYPAFASENNIECCVFASIVINDDGTLDVNGANCKDCKMKDHVIKAIEKAKNTDLAQYAGQNVLVKINFTLLD